jgi:hypothetical protein
MGNNTRRSWTAVITVVVVLALNKVINVIRG